MKNISNILTLALIFVLALSCRKDEVNLDRGFAGCWELVSRSDEAVTDFSVYMCFNSDGTFTLYQKLQAPVYYSYAGTWSTSDGVLDGYYNDGSPWASSYSYEFSDNGAILYLKTVGSFSGETQVFFYTNLPKEVSDNAVPQVKSSDFPGKVF